MKIREEDKFINSLGKVVDFSIQQKAAIEGTKLYTPEKIKKLLQDSVFSENHNSAIEVTDETTQVAAHRLVTIEGCFIGGFSYNGI